MLRQGRPGSSLHAVVSRPSGRQIEISRPVRRSTTSMPVALAVFILVVSLHDAADALAVAQPGTGEVGKQRIDVVFGPVEDRGQMIGIDVLKTRHGVSRRWFARNFRIARLGHPRADRRGRAIPADFSGRTTRDAAARTVCCIRSGHQRNAFDLGKDVHPPGESEQIPGSKRDPRQQLRAGAVSAQGKDDDNLAMAEQRFRDDARRQDVEDRAGTGSRAGNLTSLAAIRSRCRLPAATGGAGTSRRAPATRSVSNP